MAVLAALNIKAAKAVTMGISVGSKVANKVHIETKDVVDKMPEDIQKHVRPLIDSLCKIAGIALAFTFAHLVQTINAAVRGGSQFCEYILYYVVKHKSPPLVFALLDPDGDGKPNVDPSSVAYRYTFMGIAGVGLTVQLGILSIPWPLSTCFSLLLIPGTMMEVSLAISIGMNISEAMN